MQWLQLPASLITVTVHLLVLPAVCASSNQNGVVSFEWQRLDWRCVDTSASLSCSSHPVRSEFECMSFVQALGKRELVMQWNAGSGQCCAFTYQQACRMQQDTASVSECQLYIQSGQLQQFAHSLSHKLVGAWVAGAGSDFLNLVCESSTSGQLYPSNIAWSAEGATFNGVDSHILVNKSMDLSGGFAWLMRLKRTVRTQPLFETADCSNLMTYGSHMWTNPGGTQLYYGSNSLAGPFLFATSEYGTLSSDSNAWIRVGVTGANSTNFLKFFNENGFVDDSRVTKSQASPVPMIPVCMVLGHRFAFGTTLQGTVNAFAMAKATMTEEEIRTFFDLLP